MIIQKFKEVLQKAERLIESYGMEEVVVEDVWELFEENGIFPTCRQVIDYIEEVQKRFILRGSLPYC
jgi:hypothetical protein